MMASAFRRAAGGSFDPGRRRWLRNCGALASALGVGTLGNLVSGVRPAHAADYRALVCVFLYGGNDGMNMIVPSDSATYAQYAGIRGRLALPKETLVPLSAIPYGLHPAMDALSSAAAGGRLAPVFNVGPLAAPLTKAQYRAATANTGTLPSNLFSHADQQILWQSGGADSLVHTGWGGRSAAELRTVNPVISVAGSPRFGMSDTQSALTLPGPGETFAAYGLQRTDTSPPQLARRAAIDALYAEPQDVALADAYADQQRSAFTVSARLAPIVLTQPGSADGSAVIDAAFAPLIVAGKITTDIGRQLYQLAKLIAGNATVQGNRQIFFASMGGFDTHGVQVDAAGPTAGTHAALLGALADAMAAFDGALSGLGLGNAVTTFTQSDFGRTFVPNASHGTDHGWGNQQLVMGGAVHGNASYGTYPSLVLGGPDDVGQDAWELQGRWIPTTSVDQYAATLLRWFGASDAQLDAVLPNLGNFGTRRDLGFV